MATAQRTRQTGRGRTRRAMLGVLGAAAVAAPVGGYLWYRDRVSDTRVVGAGHTGPAPALDGPLGYVRRQHPARTVVTVSGRPVATFTDGARIVDLVGPQRTFRDPKFTTATVAQNDWIRLAPQPWHAGAEKQSWFRPWLEKAVADRGLDAFGTAMQYLAGAPAKKNAKGIVYAGDAGFGPSDASSEFGRDEKSDFYDYLGVSWTFPGGKVEKPEKDRYRCLDCSGFLRMVYGYRLGYPLHDTNTHRAGSLPRRAYAIDQYGPGTLVVKNTGQPVADYGPLQPGDMVFFNTDPVPGYVTNHSGIYLGIDSTGHRRFISSRVGANGPTFGDKDGSALLDDGGYYSLRFRAARRI